ncbi:low temperature requirement protein A [Rathayibacter tanaceti]|uniref:Low temperature requirement protein A n=1 Tax=Rathayibacter tanaceti TaxID=1671680 RepID=A0AAE6RLH5_9MICO|nr:low temperature requirement protein A [Rathayibacter tanaceti]
MRGPSSVAGARRTPAGSARRTGIVRRRDPEAPHRTVTPLELLFDLAFVVAFGQAADQLSHHLIDSRVETGIVGFVYAIFAIASVWVSFTWFTSAFGMDDWLYRAATMVQMIGVVVLALGLPAMFASLDQGGAVDARGMVAGYVVMRLATVVQWLRLAVHDPAARRSALLHAALVSGVLAGWFVLVLVEPTVGVFFTVAALLFAGEISGTRIVEKQNGPVPWHAGHVAERFGLLAIVALGEGVFGTVASVSAIVQGAGWSPEAVTIVVAGIGLTFGLWWMYFLIPAADALRSDRRKAQPLIYLHLILYAAIVATGAGLHVAAYAVEGRAPFGTLGTVVATAVPVAVLCTAVMLTYSYLRGTFDVLHGWLFAVTAVVLLLAGALAAGGAPLAVCLLVVTAAPLVSVVGDEVAQRGRQ